jgi:signal transduction histidine kinase
MTTYSLRLRLFAAAAISIAVALSLTGLAIINLYERQVLERVQADLNNDLLQIAGSIEVSADGTIRTGAGPADPRFQEPYGGRYWRIDFAPPGAAASREPLRSPSLWDADLDPTNPKGPEGENLITTNRRIEIDSGGKTIGLWIMVAAQEEEVSRPIGQLRDQLVVALTLIGIVLAIGAWIQVEVGLSPLATLRRHVADVRAGQADKLSGGYPSEVAPLVGELNDVLEMRERSLERARRRAGDLAHGLKTPLTVLQAISRELRKRNFNSQAADIDEQAETMRRHVERALVRARLATGRGHHAALVKPIAEKLVAAMERMPRGEDLEWEINIPADAALPVEPGDLTELIGNVLDNARKWAKSRVRISFGAGDLMIEDDGPGVPESELGIIAERGRRLDESMQGSGLGLSIVEDIADIYSLSALYDRSELGGLRVTVGV